MTLQITHFQRITGLATDYCTSNDRFGIKYYIYHLNHDIPQYMYWGFLISFCVAVVLLLLWKGIKMGRDLSKLLLVEYLSFMSLMTIVYRKECSERKYDFTPFWSYNEIMDGKEWLLVENIMNLVVFMPIGLLLGCSFRTMNWKLVLAIGCVLSVGIELFQFILKRGFTEFDDVMHNTLGCMIGYGIFSLIRYGYEQIHKRRMAVL